MDSFNNNTQGEQGFNAQGSQNLNTGNEDYVDKGVS